MRIVLATRNPDKVKEIRDILRGRAELLSLSDFAETTEVEEDGTTFRANALKKARTALAETGLPSLADDSGLEVDALDGAPGVFSSRFAGKHASTQENNEKLLRLLKGVPRAKRTARFRCVVAYVDEEQEHCVEGVCEGVILDSLHGSDGFGYDPVFYLPAQKRTFAEMRREEKNAISHRGIAFRRMVEFLSTLKEGG